MSVRTMARVWAESTHSGSHLLMLLAIADFADDDGRAYPAVSTLAHKCRMKPRNANVILAALKASGELQVRAGQGPRSTNLYRVNLPLQEHAGVQGLAGVQRLAAPPAEACSQPLQRLADKPSLNHQEPPKARKRTKVSYFIPNDMLPEWVPVEAWRAYLAHRDAIGRPASHEAQRLAVNKLQRWRDDGHDPAAILENTVMNGYQGLFVPKDGAAGSAHRSPKQDPDLTAMFRRGQG